MSDTKIYQPDQAAPQLTFGKYRVETVLGQGGMGLVYKCYDPDLERQVAVKTIHKELLEGEMGAELLARFRTEMRAAGKLTHPNIVAVYDTGTIEGQPYFVMEYVEGRELADYIKEGYKFPLAQVVEIITGVLDGLIYTHNIPVTHRDIKPANIFLTETLCPKIADFGIAKVDSSELTRVGTVLGSPRYMSPEQCVGEAVDPRSDLFSVAIVLYELLTGEHCFNAQASHTVIQKILNTEPDRPTTLNPALPKGLDKVLDKALQKKPGDRYQSAEAFKQAILEAVNGGGKASNNTWLGMAAAAVLLAGAGGGVWLMQSDAPTAPEVTPPPQVSTAPPPPVSTTPQVKSLSLENQQKVEKFLRVASMHIEIGRLVSPAGSSAYDAYQMALEIDPDNNLAQAGLHELEAMLVERIRTLWREGDADMALANSRAGMEIFPEQEEFSNLAQLIQMDAN